MTILKRIIFWKKPVENPFKPIPIDKKLEQAYKFNPFNKYDVTLLKPSSDCYDLIKHYEGFSSVVYNCPAGIPTIGYGHALKKGEKFPSGITKSGAHALLIDDVAIAEEGVKRLVKVQLSQGMYDALCSFIYNLGETKVANSSLIMHLNNKDYMKAQGQFRRWIYSGNKILNGLRERRKAEANLFGKGL